MSNLEQTRELCKKIVDKTGLPAEVAKGWKGKTLKRIDGSVVVRVANKNAPRANFIEVVFKDQTVIVDWKIKFELSLGDPDFIDNFRSYLASVLEQQLQTHYRTLEKRIDMYKQELEHLDVVLDDLAGQQL